MARDPETEAARSHVVGLARPGGKRSASLTDEAPSRAVRHLHVERERALLATIGAISHPHVADGNVSAEIEGQGGALLKLGVKKAGGGTRGRRSLNRRSRQGAAHHPARAGRQIGRKGPTTHGRNGERQEQPEHAQRAKDDEPQRADRPRALPEGRPRSPQRAPGAPRKALFRNLVEVDRVPRHHGGAHEDVPVKAVAARAPATPSADPQEIGGVAEDAQAPVPQRPSIGPPQ